MALELMAPPHIACDRIMSACYEFKKQISASLYLNNLMIILLIVFTGYMRLVLMVYPMLFSSIRIVIPLQSTALKVGVVLCKHRIHVFYFIRSRFFRAAWIVLNFRAVLRLK